MGLGNLSCEAVESAEEGEHFVLADDEVIALGSRRVETQALAHLLDDGVKRGWFLARHRSVC
jgi:hypothetical protein